MPSVFARVLAPGPLTLVEDLGRPGAADLGLGPSGALDRRSLMLANRLAGNRPGAAGLEVLLGGLELRFEEAARIAVTGARGPLQLDGQAVPLHAGCAVAAGSVLRLGPAEAGLRYYLAVDGGVDAPLLLGSASADVLSGMGPPALSAGDLLRRSPGRDGREFADGGVDTAGVLTVRDPPAPGRAITLRITEGARRDWFDGASWRRLTGREWEISPDSNRIGVRLLGTPLTQLRQAELPSEGMVTGALQIPPSGLPTIFLADHPVTGGYPVIAVVRRADLDLLGQGRPGQKVRFLAPGLD